MCPLAKLHPVQGLLVMPVLSSALLPIIQAGRAVVLHSVPGTEHPQSSMAAFIYSCSDTMRQNWLAEVTSPWAVGCSTATSSSGARSRHVQASNVDAVCLAWIVGLTGLFLSAGKQQLRLQPAHRSRGPSWGLLRSSLRLWIPADQPQRQVSRCAAWALSTTELQHARALGVHAATSHRL